MAKMGRRVHWNGLSPSKGREHYKFPLKNYCLTYKDVYNFAFVHLNLHTSCSSLSVVLCPLPIAISQFTIAHIAHCAQTLIGVQLRLKIGPASISSPPRFYALAHATVGGCPNYKRLRVCPHISKVSSYLFFF